MTNDAMNQTLVGSLGQAELAGIGILCAFVAVIFGAWRRDVSLLTGLAALGMCGVAAGIGARLYWVVLHGAGFADLVRVEAGFSSFGAILGGGLALLVIRSGLVEDELEFRRLLDVLVPSGLVALAWARLGCLANACDFGRVTGVPWGIRYPQGTEVFDFHAQMGWVAGSSTFSAPVHPLPVYLFGACLAGVVVAGFSASRPGRSAGWAVVLYAGIRAFAELYRAPMASTTFFGVSTAILASLALLTAGVVWIGWVHTRPLVGQASPQASPQTAERGTAPENQK